MRLAVCDDDVNFLRQLKPQIEEWSRTHNHTIKLAMFSKSNRLYTLVQTGTVFDIFLLDVEMERPDGKELALHIHRHLPGATTIFLTAYDKYVPEGYEFGVLRCIPKVNVKNKLQEALNAAWTAQVDFQRKNALFLVVHQYHESARVFYSNIVYVKYENRKCVVVTADNQTYTISNGIQKVFKSLQDERFMWITRSTFINVEYVDYFGKNDELKSNEVLLNTGTILEVSGGLVQNVKEKVAEYLGGLIS